MLEGGAEGGAIVHTYCEMCTYAAINKRMYQKMKIVSRKIRGGGRIFIGGGGGGGERVTISASPTFYILVH